MCKNSGGTKKNQEVTKKSGVSNLGRKKNWECQFFWRKFQFFLKKSGGTKKDLGVSKLFAKNSKKNLRSQNL